VLVNPSSNPLGFTTMKQDRTLRHTYNCQNNRGPMAYYNGESIDP